MDIPAKNFMSTIMVNVDNEKLSDSDFRQMIRNTLPIVEKMPLETLSEIHQPSVKKYYRS